MSEHSSEVGGLLETEVKSQFGASSLIIICEDVILIRYVVFTHETQVTGDPLIQRKDDTSEALKLRLEAFRQQTKPVSVYYPSFIAYRQLLSHIKALVSILSSFDNQKYVQVIDYYSEKGVVAHIQAGKPSKEVTAEVHKVLSA
ncbi:unnamed protein product [Fraxinus pennsylvanica]|uniref:Uncharacterized protein n=1 Tax=Fraxinus pennsylvanica TaxID=56036 RepID=A0AAD2A652_9LAMI|nr:unnamed protein product [Fraxinus pennsylvanica]